MLEARARANAATGTQARGREDGFSSADEFGRRETGRHRWRPAAPEATNTAASEDDSPEALAAQVKQYETDYQNTADFQKKVVVIYNLSAVDSPETVDAIGRLFLNEKDKELKIELVNSLLDIDGQNDKKLAILSTAVHGDQPKDVRLEGIDGMGDTEDKRAIQILQGMLTDPDEDIRDAAKDTIDQLQTDVAQPQAVPINGALPGVK